MGFIEIILALRGSCHDQIRTRKCHVIEEVLHICAILKEGFFKDSLELCRCSGKVLPALDAVVISLVSIGSPSSRERDGLLPRRGSLHMPHWLPSQQTHHCLTWDILVLVNTRPSSEENFLKNTRPKLSESVKYPPKLLELRTFFKKFFLSLLHLIVYYEEALEGCGSV